MLFCQILKDLSEKKDNVLKNKNTEQNLDCGTEKNLDEIFSKVVNFFQKIVTKILEVTMLVYKLGQICHF